MKDDDNPYCLDCKGRGKWQQQEESEGTITMVAKFCETCEGTGLNQEDGDVD